MRYFFVLILLSGCGQTFHSNVDPRSIVGVDSTFIPYVNKYLSYKGSALNYDIPIQFADLNGNTAGLCTRWSSGERQIQIDKEYWENYLDEGEKFEIIAHELGHCDLNRSHTQHANPAISIMDPYVFGLYDNTIANYMVELFSITNTSLYIVSNNCVKDINVQTNE